MTQNAVLYQFINTQGTFSCDSKIHSTKNKRAQILLNGSRYVPTVYMYVRSEEELSL